MSAKLIKIRTIIDFILLNSNLSHEQFAKRLNKLISTHNRQVSQGMLAEDIASELPPDIKLMAIVRADAADMLSGEGIFVLPLPVNRQSLISSIEIFLGVIEKRRKTVSAWELNTYMTRF